MLFAKLFFIVTISSIAYHHRILRHQPLHQNQRLKLHFPQLHRHCIRNPGLFLQPYHRWIRENRFRIPCSINRWWWLAHWVAIKTFFFHMLSKLTLQAQRPTNSVYLKIASPKFVETINNIIQLSPWHKLK